MRAAAAAPFDLTDADLEQGTAALTAIGANTPTNRTRLALVGGEWRLVVRVPKHAKHNGTVERPGFLTTDEWLAYETQLCSLDEGARLLADPQGPDVVVRRRKEAHEANVRRAAEEREAQSERANAEMAERARLQRQREELGERAWLELPQEARALYRVSLAARKAGLESFARDVRGVAAELATLGNTGRALAMPLEEWRK